jgi:hypothetical protein
VIEKEKIVEALSFMENRWTFQNDDKDKDTTFIYTVENVAELLECCDRKGINRNYALHRWYNFNCAKWHEHFFCQNQAVRKETNERHKTIDFYINDVPFDLKTSTFPKKANQALDLRKRKDKNDLIKWLYANQSKQNRYHLDNRLFIVCNSLKGKSDFELIAQKTTFFLDFINKNTFNQVEIGKKTVFSDVIFIES